MTENQRSCCTTFLDRAELITRAIFCTPRRKSGDESDFDDFREHKSQIFLRSLSFGFAVFKLMKFGFDCRGALHLIQNGFHTEGALLLTGMALAWIVSSFGQSRVDRRGTFWAPFFMAPGSYYDFIPRREAILRFLFTVSFTELAAFLLEDGAYVNGYARARETLGNPNSVDAVTLWLTFIKAIAAVIVLLLALVSAMNCGGCLNKRDQEDKSWTTWFESTIFGPVDDEDEDTSCLDSCCIGLWNATKVVVFVLIWLAAFGVIAVNAFLVICLLEPDDSPLSVVTVSWHDKFSEAWYPLIISWIFALYFSIALVGQREELEEESTSWVPAEVFGTDQSPGSKGGWW